MDKVLTCFLTAVSLLVSVRGQVFKGKVKIQWMANTVRLVTLRGYSYRQLCNFFPFSPDKLTVVGCIFGWSYLTQNIAGPILDKSLTFVHVYV